MSELQPLTEEYYGTPPPKDAPLPTSTKLLCLCTGIEDIPMGFAYPPERPVFWIKYGCAVQWNEAVSQALAYRELQKLGSGVRAPALYYACKVSAYTYLVMEYVSGKSGAQLLEATTGVSEKEKIYKKIASAVEQMLRIPVPPGSRPASVSGGVIEHRVFREILATRHYNSADQLEQHFNEFLKLTKEKARISDLSREPLVFSHPDIHPGNFMISDQGSVTIIDFAGASFLPSSFVKFTIKLKSLNAYDMCPLIDFPSTDGVDNTTALFPLARKMMMGWGSFANVGRRIPAYVHDEHCKPPTSWFSWLSSLCSSVVFAPLGLVTRSISSFIRRFTRLF